MDIFSGDEILATLEEQQPQYQTGRFSGRLFLDGTGQHTLRAYAVNNQEQVIGISEPVSLEIKSFDGSLPPTALLQPLPFTSITSTSTISFSASGNDDDGSIDGLQFYVDGVAYGAEMKLPDGVIDDNYIFSKLWSPGSPGVYSVHVVARDKSGNYVSSEVQTITSTIGSVGPSLSFVSPFEQIDLNASELMTVDESGGITGFDLPEGVTLSLIHI